MVPKIYQIICVVLTLTKIKGHDTSIFNLQQKTEPTIDKKDIENLGQQTNLEISKVKSDVSSIKSMMNETVMIMLSEKDNITKEVQDADTQKRFKEIEKIILPFLYNLQNR